MKIKCNTAPASSGARNKAPKTHSWPSLYHRLQSFSTLLLCNDFSFAVVLFFSNEKDKWNCSFSNSSVHRDLTSTKLTCAGIPWLFLPEASCRSLQSGNSWPAPSRQKQQKGYPCWAPGLQGWETQGGGKEPFAVSNLAIITYTFLSHLTTIIGTLYHGEGWALPKPHASH